MKSPLFYSQLFNALPAASLVVLPDYPTFTIIEVNDAFEALAKLPKDALIGKGVFDALPDHVYTEDSVLTQAFLAVVENKRPYKLPIINSRAGTGNTTSKYFQSISTPLFNDTNEVECIVYTIIDSHWVQNEGASLNSAPHKGQQFLEETQKIANVGSWEVDFVNNTVFWSDVVKEIYEVESDFVPDFSYRLTFYKGAESHQKIIQAIHDAKELGQSYDLELPIRTAKGNDRWIRTTGQPEIHQGRCIRIYGAIQDITQKKIIERNLLASKDRLQSLLETVEGVVWESDLDTLEPTYMSDKVKSFTGYPSEYWTKYRTFWQDHIYHEDREETIQLFSSLQDNPRSLTLNYRLNTADGRIIWIRDRMTVVHENGRPKWIRGLMVDNTSNQHSSQLRNLENTVLQTNAIKDVPIEELLATYLTGIEELFPKIKCSIYKVGEHHLEHWSSPSLPREFLNSLATIPLEDSSTPMTKAVVRKESIIIKDILNNPEAGHINAVPYGLHACWSYPIVSSGGEVLAVFVIYANEAKEPDEEENFVGRTVSLLRIIIENRYFLKALQEASVLMKHGQDLAKLGYWQWDIVRDRLKWSDSLYTIYGLDDTFLPTPEKFLQVVHPEDRQEIQGKFENALVTKTDFEFEIRIVPPDGEIRFLKSWTKVVVDEKGNAIELIGACLDVTESKRAEEELSQRESLLKSLVEELHTSNERYEYVNRTTNNAIFDWDIRKNLIHWGDGFFRLFGYQTAPETFTRESSAAFIHPLDRDQIIADFNNLLDDSGQNSWTKEYRFLKSDGNYAFVEDSSYVIRDHHGRAIRMIGALRDISSRKLNEAKMTALHEELERNLKVLEISNAELEQFAHVVSHDLQEPLRMITNFLAQLERKYGDIIDDKGKQYIFYAVDGAKRMRQIILDLLNFSTVSQLDDDPEEVDLNNLVRDVLALYKRKILATGATVEYEALPVLFTAKRPMRLIFQNLIRNALMYQSKGNKPYIQITSEDNDSFWKFSVADNGVGIDKVSYDKIFIIFQRLQQHGDMPGTGMGLAVVKKILESFGGRIWVESESGKGSTFHFTIPKTKGELS